MSTRAETWKRLLMDEGFLREGHLHVDHSSVEIKFPYDAAYVLDPQSTRWTAVDKGEWLVFYAHGRNPIYHLWDDISSVLIRS